LTRSGAARVAGVLVLAAIGVLVWSRWGSDDERAIRERIEALRSAVNRPTGDGLATVAHAAAIGSYFTDDVVVDLGEGTAPIQGRLTLIGMVERLHPRTSAFRMEVDDLGVELTPGAATAEATLTVSFIGRSQATGEESRDAREFALALTKASGTWRIARVTAIDVLR